MRKILVVGLLMLATNPANAQVFNSSQLSGAGRASFLQTLEKVDEETIDKKQILSLSGPGGEKKFDRVWVTGPLQGLYPPAPVGYGFAKPAERVRFAEEYLSWLMANGESTANSNFVPYSHRLAFANNWWTEHAVARFKMHEPDQWCRDSLVDAGLLLCDTASKLKVANQDLARDDDELNYVRTKSDRPDHVHDPQKFVHDGKAVALPEIDKTTVGKSFDINGRSISRVYTSGYGGTTPAVRAQFIVAYESWANTPKPLSYYDRLRWSEQWWTDNCPAYRELTYGGSLTISPWKAWARDAIADANVLSYLVELKSGRLGKTEDEEFRDGIVKGAELAQKDAKENDSKLDGLFHLGK